MKLDVPVDAYNMTIDFSKIVFYEELRGGVQDFPDIVANGAEAKSEWETHYIWFMQQMNDERIAAVGRLI
jgi:hypothetical protein